MDTAMLNEVRESIRHGDSVLFEGSASGAFEGGPGLPEDFPLKPPYRIQALTGDGSDRRFYRIRAGGTSLILVASPRKRPPGETDECDSYALIGMHLAARGIPVPRFEWSDPLSGLFLLEDLGDLHLQGLVLRPRSEPLAIYRSVVSMLVGMHREAREGFDARFCFDTPLYDAPFAYERELEYFRKAFLNGALGLDVGEDDLRSDFERLAEDAEGRNPGFVIHRDFQSRNIMVHRGRLRLIDFQGMRFGPPLYDLASLLLDPYVKLSPPLQATLADLYWKGAEAFLGLSRRGFVESYAAVRLCRNLQVLGAYGFLGVVRGKRGFLRHVPAAWKSLREWMDGPCRSRYPKVERLVRSVTPRMESDPVRFGKSFT